MGSKGSYLGSYQHSRQYKDCLISNDGVS